MLRTLIYLSTLSMLCCSPSEQIIEIRTTPTGSIDAHFTRLDVYLTDASREKNCETITNTSQIESELYLALHYKSLTEFESQGFAEISFDHIASSKKLLVFILAYDVESNRPVGMACLDNVQVEKNALREIHVVLTPLRENIDD